jgi:hypothetical protein
VCASLAVRDTLPVDYCDNDCDSDGRREEREEKREGTRDDRRSEKGDEMRYPNAPSSGVSLHASIPVHLTRDGMTTQLASKISRLVAAFGGVKDVIDQKPPVVSVTTLSSVLFCYHYIDLSFSVVLEVSFLPLELHLSRIVSVLNF